MKIIAGKDAGIVSDQQEVIDLMEEMLARIRGGDLQGSNRVIIIATTHDHDTFATECVYYGSALANIGLLRLAEGVVLDDINGD